jgi:hypothetical protein
MSVIVRDMYSTVLSAGVTAAIAAGSTGPKIDITGFQIGSSSAAQGATVDENDTGVDNWVYSGDASQIYYALLPDSDACLFRIVLDENVGDFQVGQICLMIGDTAFSKSVLYRQQAKWKSVLPSRYGNVLTFDLVLAISDAQSCINLTMLQDLYASLPEVADETYLPNAFVTIYNTYLVRNHTELGVPTVASRRNGAWHHAPHRQVAGQGEGVLAVAPALFHGSVRINMAVYFDYNTGKYMPARADDEIKYAIGVRTSLCEITQTGFIHRYVADDIWPATLTPNTVLSVQTATPGVPGTAATCHPYGYVVSNKAVYVDFAGDVVESWLVQQPSLAGKTPLSRSHGHDIATEEKPGFMPSNVYLALIDDLAAFALDETGLSECRKRLDAMDLTIGSLGSGSVKFSGGTTVISTNPDNPSIVALVQEEIKTRTTETSALAYDMKTVKAQVGSNTASITSLLEASVTPDASTALQLTTLRSRMNDAEGAITVLQSTVSNISGDTIVVDLTEVTAKANAATANGLYSLTASASPSNGAQAEYKVYIKASTNSSSAATGMSLQAFSDGTSRVKFTANQFMISDGVSAYAPFQIASGKIIANMTVNSGNVSGLGALGLVDKLTSNNLATYMDTGVIKQAYIGNAEVGTLKIAGNAVTVTSNIIWGACYGNGSYQSLGTGLTVTNSASVAMGVLIVFTARLGYTIVQYPNTISTGYKLYKNGAVLHNFGEIGVINDFPCFSWYDTIAANSSANYQVYFFGTNSNVHAAGGSLTVIGCKR